ncbi:MAG TPA: LuxR C-terminal-related transcriptional regulator [Gaiellaceae bacterium]|jgi:DNA-binding CsgD family transcriptional regulator
MTWDPFTPLPVVVGAAVGCTFVAAGAVARLRRPENGTGTLLLLAGAAWLVSGLSNADASLPDLVNDLAFNLFLAVLAHLIVTYPYGRVRLPRERFLVVAAYTLAVGNYVVGNLFRDPRLEGCDGCPKNLLLVHGDHRLYALANVVLPLVAIVLGCTILAHIVARWREATAAARRALEPISWTGPAAIVVAVLWLARDAGVPPASDIGAALDWAALAYAAIPLAFLGGLLRTRLRRAALGELVLELSERPSRERVQAALARALGDPSLEIAVRPSEVPEGRAVTMLEPGGLAIVHDASLLEDHELVEAAAAAARLTLPRSPTPLPLAELTAREREVLALLAEGRTDRGIAQALFVTPKTVEAHVRSIFRKLDLPADSTENRRVHAVLRYLHSA